MPAGAAKEEGEINLAAFSEPAALIQPIAPVAPVVNPKAYAAIGTRRITLTTHPLQASLCLGGGALAVLGGLALIVWRCMDENWSSGFGREMVAMGMIVLLAGAGLIARGLGVEAPHRTEYTQAIEKERDWAIGKAYGGTYLLLFVVFVLNMAVIVPIWVRLFPDPPASGYAAAGMIGVLLALGELYAVEKITGRELLGLDLSDRSVRLGGAGLLVAFAFAIGLFAFERNNQISGVLRAEESRIHRDAYYERLRDPSVQRGMEAMQQIQALREQRNANPDTE